MTRKQTWQTTALCLTLLGVTGAGCSHAPPRPDVRGQEVTYAAGGTALKGYLAYDAAKTGEAAGRPCRPRVVGAQRVRAQAREDARRAGYTALAVDMYGDGKQAAHPGDAGKIRRRRSSRTWTAAKARFLAARDLLQAQTAVDPERIAAIGYCFGGGIVLNMARAGS